MKTVSYLMILVALLAVGCNPPVQSASGTKMATAGHLNTDQHGHTVEQNNIINKVQIEADPNHIWYLFIVSPYNQKLILQSTVKGKVTSSGKRLTPKEVRLAASENGGMSFVVNGTTFYTNEMPAEDGTYGSSAEYIYWTDVNGVNHRHYLSDGESVHLVDKPIGFGQLFAQ